MSEFCVVSVEFPILVSESEQLYQVPLMLCFFNVKSIIVIFFPMLSNWYRVSCTFSGICTDYFWYRDVPNVNTVSYVLSEQLWKYILLLSISLILIKQQKRENKSFTASNWIDENHCVFFLFDYFIQFL